MVNDHISIALGIIIGLLASFVQSLGLTIQRKSHVQNQSLPEHRQRLEHRRPLWLLGFAIFISSNVIGSFVQIASLPVVILAPLGAVSLLWNAFFARLLLGDKFSPWMVLGTILIAGGAILIAFFGIVPEPTRSLEDLLLLFRRPAFIAYFSVLGSIVFISLAITHIAEYSLSRKIAKEFPAIEDTSDFSPSSITISLPADATNLTTSISENVTNATTTTEQTPLLYSKPKSTSTESSSSTDLQHNSEALCRVNRIRLLLAISYASFSGIISGMCLLFAKSGVELLVLTFGGDNQFRRWETWMLVLGLIVFALLQLWYLHKALVLADPTLVCPSAFCFYNLSSIVNGLVYFDQFSLIPPIYLALVSLGIFVLLCGVWIVSIQPGSGGGVDVGPWAEEGVNLPGEDLALYASPENEDADRSSQYAYVRDQDAAPVRSSPRIGPVPMERSTVSESDMHNFAKPIGLGIDLGPEHDEERLTQSAMLPSSKRQRASTTLYTSPRVPHHRRSTAEPSPQVGHSRTASYPYPPNGHLPLSPSGTGSTISTGFQIGLSPLSPGFTILPLERRRRHSGLQTGASMADVANEVVEDIREERRAVSEAGTSQGATRGEDPGASDSHVEAENANIYSTHRRARENGHRRWQWLQGVIGKGRR